MKDKFKQIFSPIPHIDLLPPHKPACIHLKYAYKKISTHSYSCPHQYCDAFASLIQQCLDSGFIHPSSSSFASPSFIVPKKDPKAIPCWVCDYCQLNANTISDNYPLPHITEILTDCGKGKIWSTIDMTNSFFQTCIHPDNIHKMAITTPLGAYEWCVMPMGICNSPPIHQRLCWPFSMNILVNSAMFTWTTLLSGLKTWKNTHSMFKLFNKHYKRRAYTLTKQKPVSLIMKLPF